MSVSRLVNNLRYNRTSAGACLIQDKCETSYKPSQEELEQIQARQLESQRLDMACAIVELAERLVSDHNVSVETAFETAKEMASQSRSFIENFKL